MQSTVTGGRSHTLWFLPEIQDAKALLDVDGPVVLGGSLYRKGWRGRLRIAKSNQPARKGV